MIRGLLVCLFVGFLFSCHDTSDHNIHGPEPDIADIKAKNQKPDTSHHMGTIIGFTDKLTHELKDAEKAVNTEIAFIKLITIHRKALIDIANVELSVGGREGPVVLASDIISRSYKLIGALSKIVIKDTSVQKPHQLLYKIPMSENDFEKMAHSGSDDQLSLEMSVLIEKSEIMIARSYLKTGKDSYLRDIAVKLIKDNTNEIAKLASLNTIK